MPSEIPMQPTLFDGIIDGERTQVRIKGWSGSYTLVMLVFNDSADVSRGVPPHFTWRRGNLGDKFEDYKIKGNLLGHHDFIELYDKQKMEVIWLYGDGGYIFEQWRKPKQGEVRGSDRLIGKAEYVPPTRWKDKANIPQLTGVYKKTNHSGLQARHKKGIQDSNRRYQPRLEKVIAQLEKEGKIKL